MVPNGESSVPCHAAFCAESPTVSCSAKRYGRHGTARNDDEPFLRHIHLSHSLERIEFTTQETVKDGFILLTVSALCLMCLTSHSFRSRIPCRRPSLTLHVPRGRYPAAGADVGVLRDLVAFVDVQCQKEHSLRAICQREENMPCGHLWGEQCEVLEDLKHQ